MKKKSKKEEPVIYVPYGQHFCPFCMGIIDTGFKCLKCGKQYQPIRK